MPEGAGREPQAGIVRTALVQNCTQTAILVQTRYSPSDRRSEDFNQIRLLSMLWLAKLAHSDGANVALPLDT